MTALPQVTQVHPETVQRYSEGETFFPKRRRLRSVQSDPELTTIQVHPTVWRLALRDADGDARRIEVHSPTSVTVHSRRVT